MVSGVWFVVAGLWFLVGWFLVSGLWFVVSGFWFLVSGRSTLPFFSLSWFIALPEHRVWFPKDSLAWADAPVVLPPGSFRPPLPRNHSGLRVTDPLLF